jgi:hypothetical protein
MPFVPRSQLEQKQQAAAPPNMPVVENFQAKQPATDHSTPHDNTEEQIAELNELLIHVLDELADMKQVLRTNAAATKDRPKPSSKRRPPSDDEEKEEESSEEEVPEEPERAAQKAPPRKRNAPHSRPRGYDFSGCF